MAFVYNFIIRARIHNSYGDSTPLFSLSHLIHTQTSSKRLFIKPYFKTNPIRILCSSSSSFPQSTITHETIAPLPPNNSVNNTTPQKKWEAHRKRKVLMRVGYVGIDSGTLEEELETAIYKAGGIRDSNFGDLQKIAWGTSSQIDDEVHSLSTMISFKMEIPEYAWIGDPNGTLLADIGKHPFHNYTINQRKKCPTNENSINDPLIFDKWLHEPDENDRITDFHFRRILHCSCGKVKHIHGTSYVEISICGESFMLHQIRKLVATAVAVKRGLLPKDVIPLSLNKFTRFVLPVAPYEVLYLRFNHFILEKESGKTIRPEIMASVESEKILKDVEGFYDSMLLPWFLELLDPVKSPWKEWVELLDSNTKIPDSQLDQVRNAWIKWEENSWINSCKAGEEDFA